MKRLLHTLRFYPFLLCLASAIGANAQAKRITPPNSNIQVSKANLYKQKLKAAATIAAPTAPARAKVQVNPVDPPYLATFDSQESIDSITIIDANGDAGTLTNTTKNGQWGWYYGGELRYTYSSTNDADDWAIMEPVRLQAKTSYIVSLDARASGYGTEKLNVHIGKSTANVKTFQQLNPDTLIITGSGINNYSYSFIPDEDGVYSIALHCVSPADQLGLNVDNVGIKLGATAKAPAAVTDAKAQGAGKGSRRVVISFRAPDHSVDGSAITSVSKVVVTRSDDSEVGTVENLAAGAEGSVTDNRAANGNNTYYIIPYIGEEAGAQTQVQAFAGVDRPDIPTVTLDDHNDGTYTLHLSSSEVGENGNYVDPTKVSYQIYTVDATGATSTNPIATVRQGANSYDGTFPSVTSQQEYTLAITATNLAGTSYAAVVSTIIGPNLELPFHEGFRGGAPERDGWMVYSVVGGSQYAQWGTDSHYGFDANEDGSSATYYTYAGYSEILSSGKIATRNASSLQLSFQEMFRRVNTSNSIGDTLQVLVNTASGKTDTIATFTYRGKLYYPFTRHTYDLSKYTSENWIRIQFLGIEGVTNDVFAVDDIYLIDPTKGGLMTDFYADSLVSAKDTIYSLLRVTNISSTPAKIANVTLNANSEKFNDQAGEAIPTFGYKDFWFKIPTYIYTPDTVSLYATVGDKPYVTETLKVVVVKPDFAPATDLTATKTGNNVTLNWKAPETIVEDVMDDFESYDAFSIAPRFGDWKNVDRDSAQVYTIGGESGILNYDNYGLPTAYMVFNPTKAGATDAAWNAHSGSQYLMSMASNGKQNDDWLISPALSGNAQTIFFYANMPMDDFESETYEVLYSTGSTNPDDFIKIGGETITKTGWQEKAYDLPEGAKYFAIRHTSTNKYVLSIDDVTYQKGGMPILGYNIYSDGKVVGTVNGETTTWNGPADGNNYAVSVIYSEGESVLSNIGVLTGISNIRTNQQDDADAPAYNIAGQRVDRSYRGIVIRNGKKFLNNK